MSSPNDVGRKIKVFRIVSKAEYNNNNNTQDDCSTLAAISYQQDIKKKKKVEKENWKLAIRHLS